MKIIVCNEFISQTVGTMLTKTVCYALPFQRCMVCLEGGNILFDLKLTACTNRSTSNSCQQSRQKSKDCICFETLSLRWCVNRLVMVSYRYIHSYLQVLFVSLCVRSGFDYFLGGCGLSIFFQNIPS